MESVVVIENLKFSYNSRPVLVEVNLHINQFDFVSMIGPNGGGKTTLLKLMLGLLKPDEGSITVLNKSPEKARGKIGYVPQNYRYDARFPIEVIDVVLMGRLGSGNRFGGFGNTDKNIALECLKEVDIDSAANRPFSELSGGQRQRVLIARAMATKPEILILDEPTANIDPMAQEELYNLLQRINEKLTIIMVTHDTGFVAPSIKSVVCVNQKVVMHPTHEVNNQVITDLYGGDVRFISHSDTTCPHPEDCERCVRLEKSLLSSLDSGDDSNE